MSIVSFEILKSLTGFRDIEFILHEACRKATNQHPTFSRDKKFLNFENRKEDPYYKLYADGNVVKVFFSGTRICGNFELAGRWQNNKDTLMYLNVFQIDHDEGSIELIQTSRYQIKVDKKANDDSSDKIYALRGEEPKSKKKKSMGIGKYFFPVVLSVGGLYLAKKQFLDGGLSLWAPDSIDKTLDRVSNALNISKY